jgi:cell fate regulator YaaT (PSP1 superfamily)
MVTDIVEMKKEEQWKVVGSPARRASINPLPEEPDMRARAASIPGFAFHVDAEGPPPPGFDAQPDSWTGNSIWATGNGPDEHDLKERFAKKKLNGPDVQIMSEEEYSKIPQNRSRSKSSSAIFAVAEEEPFDPNTIPDMSSIWNNKNEPLVHRRASTQPSQQTLMWEALRAAQLATENDMNGQNTDELLEKFKNENMRRFSVAPSMVNRFMSRNVDETNVLSVPSPEGGRRRHSMAGPIYERKLNTKMLSQGFQALGLTDATQQLERIDDYFENTSSRDRAFREAGKNLQAIQDIVSPTVATPAAESDYTWPLYVVEFKAGRTDYFYVPEDTSIDVHVGDVAIVEADRGKDLGKVIETSINSLQELQMYQATHVDSLVDSHNAVGKEITPKRIFRLAEPGEVAMLLAKSQDEAKANQLCQSKIRQKKLPMEIVDAEYQWDRRKLTFYFVADRRIDFRELVRELFKIYKTRIWMYYFLMLGVLSIPLQSRKVVNLKRVEKISFLHKDYLHILVVLNN